MKKYKITYAAGKNEHVLEVEAADKEQAGRWARKQLGTGVTILSVVHIPESYELELI